MSLALDYVDAKHTEHLGRLRRALALRAMTATGMSQRAIARELKISQPAVSQQLKSAAELAGVDPETLIAAAAPILNRLAEQRGFSRLALFGSVARGQARAGSDVDLLVDAPEGTTIGSLLAMRDLFQQVLGRPVDLVTYGGLGRLDDDIRSEAVLLK